MLGNVRRWEVGYFAEGRATKAEEFYREELNKNGWKVEGSDFDAGELDIQARRGDVELLVEKGQVGDLIEIEMEVQEPRPS